MHQKIKPGDREPGEIEVKLRVSTSTGKEDRWKRGRQAREAGDKARKEGMVGKLRPREPYLGQVRELNFRLLRGVEENGEASEDIRVIEIP